MGWEAVADYYMKPVNPQSKIQIWGEIDEKSSQIIDDRVQQISKEYIYPRTVDEFIADH